MHKSSFTAGLGCALFVLFAAESASAATITLAWDGSAGAEGYILRYGNTHGSYPVSIDVGAQTTYTVGGLPDGQVYCFALQARSSAGVSPLSSEVCTLADPPPGQPFVPDMNGDGRFDLLWQHQTTGQISTWLMNGTSMLTGFLLSPGQVPDTNWKIVGRGDLNGDSKTDLVWQNRSTGQVSTWLMDGSRMLNGLLLTPNKVADTNWRIVGVADANGDGKADLFWHHRTLGTVSLWLMDGSRMTHGIVMTTVPDASWQVAGVGDMNRDGHPDLVWQNQTNGQLSTWFLRGSAVLSTSMLTPSQVADTNWKIRSVADINGDGYSDLVWQHQTSGLISAWTMNGTRMTAGILLTPSQVADTNWMIVR
jgi:hypothetical protein